MNGFCRCPRCGSGSFERMKTYGHCVGCLYFEDYDDSSESQCFHALEAEKEILGAEETQGEQELPLAG